MRGDINWTVSTVNEVAIQKLVRHWGANRKSGTPTNGPIPIVHDKEETDFNLPESNASQEMSANILFQCDHHCTHTHKY